MATDFVDRNGQPFSDRMQDVLSALEPRLRRRFPALRDEVVLTEILEEAAQNIVDKERNDGPVRRLIGYTWAVVRNVATSRLRRASMRLQLDTLDSEQSAVAIADLADQHTPAVIERNVYLSEILRCLPSDERHVFLWKKAGFTSSDIAGQVGSSTGAIDTLFHRAKQKVRAFADRRRTTPGTGGQAT